MLSALLWASVALVAPVDPEARSTVERVLVRDAVAPDLAPADRTRLEARMLAALASRSIVTAEGQARDAGRACETQLCRSRTGSTHRISHWVRAEIDRDDRDYHLRISAGRMGDGAMIAESQADCLICGIDDVATVLAEHTAAVADSLAQAPPPPPPPLLLPRGPHDAGPRTTSAALRPVGIGLLVAGSVAAIGGVVLIGVDDRAIQRRCGPQEIDADGDCRYVHSTLGGGIALVTSGVFALAGGITLVTIAKRRRVTVLRARLGPGRITLAGRF